MTDRTFNTPSAPFKPSGQRTGDTSVELAIPNLSRTASATEIQRSRDRKDWTTIATVTGKALSYGDNPGGGTFYYRAQPARQPRLRVVRAVRGRRDDLRPGGTDAPRRRAARCCSSRRAGSRSRGTTTPSTAPRRRRRGQYSTDGTAWKTVTAATAERERAELPLNSTVYWRVRAKGVHADFGPWSGNSSFHVRQPRGSPSTHPARPCATCRSA
ncbi:MAG: hypothetical protein ACLTYW_00060 [Collinsella sp.]